MGSTQTPDRQYGVLTHIDDFKKSLLRILLLLAFQKLSQTHKSPLQKMIPAFQIHT